LCELWRLGPVDARGARHDRDPGLIADKVEALRGRLGPFSTGRDRIGPVIRRGLGFGVCSPSVRCGRSWL
jgi:hypothetical protein